MRIVQVITPTRVSGAERYILFLCEELIKRGHDVTVVVEKGQRLIDYLKNRLKVVPLRIEGKANVLGYLRLKKLIHVLSPSIIHTHLTTASFFGGLVGKGLNIPVISTVHAINSKWPYIMADRMIAVSNAVGRDLLNQGIPAYKLRINLNGIPLSLKKLSSVSKDKLKGLWNIPISNFVIGVVAHFSHKKGHIYLFRALSLLKNKNITLFLLGEGSLKSSLKKVCHKLSITEQVIFADFQDDVNKFYNLFDIVVLPSIKGEGLPLSILEAQNNGIPVISSSISGISEVITSGKNGYLVPPKDVRSLSHRINSLIHNNSTREKMGQIGHKIVYDKFAINRNTDTVLDIYRELAKDI